MEQLTLKFEENASDNQLEFPIIPYKGYAAQLILPGQNPIELPIVISSNSLLSVDLQKEYSAGIIHIYYRGTLVQKVSAIFSGLFFLGICVYKAFFPETLSLTNNEG